MGAGSLRTEPLLGPGLGQEQGQKGAVELGTVRADEAQRGDRNRAARIFRGKAHRVADPTRLQQDIARA